MKFCEHPLLAKLRTGRDTCQADTEGGGGEGITGLLSPVEHGGLGVQLPSVRLRPLQLLLLFHSPVTLGHHSYTWVPGYLSSKLIDQIAQAQDFSGSE